MNEHVVTAVFFALRMWLSLSVRGRHLVPFLLNAGLLSIITLLIRLSIITLLIGMPINPNLIIVTRQTMVMFCTVGFCIEKSTVA